MRTTPLPTARSPLARPTPRLPLAAAMALALGACADDARPPLAPADPPDATRDVAQDAPLVRAEGARAGTIIPGEWIVVYRDDVEDVEAKLRGQARALAARGLALDRKSVARTYDAGIKGFAATLDAKTVAALRDDPDVAYVEPDRVVTILGTQTGATWGIDRIDQRTLPLSGTYTWNAAGARVYAYIIDSGLLANHQEFSGRAQNVFDAVGGNGTDCNGHGTHVGGTVGGERFGVAKDVLLRGVRVFTCSGSTTGSAVLSGIDWVTRNHQKPAVANLSLGGGFSRALNDAVTRLANAGVFVAVAAGNESQNACNVSPASAPIVTTVAASARNDSRASFSNFGSCVDVYAPGVGITAAWHTGTTATNTISGTSMAAPHVAGVAALYKSARGDASQATVDAWIKSNATPNVITGNPTGTPNLLLFKSTL